VRTHQACPGFDLHRCRRCGDHWASNSIGLVINEFCPTCIPAVSSVLHDWRVIPEISEAEKRIQRRLDELRRKREHSVEAQRREIRERRAS
jgi:hypothetical protein